MKISIVTPTFNSEAVISNNINSILNQSYTDFEHILIDKESSDNTLNLAKKEYSIRNSIKKLRIIREKDNGIAEAFNKGINTVYGEVIGILNSDDEYFNELVLEKVMNCFKDKNILFVHGNIYFEDPIYGSNIRKPLLCNVTKAMPYNHPTMFFRKEVYKKHGIFDIDYKFAMDFEFICRLNKSIIDFNRKGLYLDGEPLVKMAAGGISWKNELNSIEETKRALKKYGFWDFNAKRNYFVRKLRTKIKYWLTVIKLEKVIVMWRKRKWGN